MNEFTFLRVYRDLAKQIARKEDIANVFLWLQDNIDEHTLAVHWLSKSVPTPVEMALSIDAVAHAIHQGDAEFLHTIFPGANYDFVKSKLDELAGTENTVEVRKMSRGYFSSILNDLDLMFLEKQQVGMTIREDIVSAIKEYQVLYKAQLASPAEILTLARYFPEDQVYQKAASRIIEEPMVVGGPASVEMIDREGHLITTEALHKAFIDFMKNPRTRNVMVLHSDVQVGWPLPAYITKQGHVFKSGVDEKGLWLISELRDDTRIAKRVIEEINKGTLKSYSIAGSAIDIQDVTKGLNTFKQVNGLEMAEITLCEKGINQGAHFDILKSIDSPARVLKTEDINKLINGVQLLKNGADIFLETGTKPQVVIIADKSNSITDALQIELRKCVPDDISIVVKEYSIDGIPLYNKPILKNAESLESEYAAVYKKANYRPSDNEDEECHICMYFEDDYCLLLKALVKEEYVCDKFELMPDGEDEEEYAEENEIDEEKMLKSNNGNNIEKFLAWMEKYDPSSYEKRDKVREGLLEEYGFPDEDDVMDEDKRLSNPKPWVVNDAGAETT